MTLTISMDPADGRCLINRHGYKHSRLGLVHLRREIEPQAWRVLKFYGRRKGLDTWYDWDSVSYLFEEVEND